MAAMRAQVALLFDPQNTEGITSMYAVSEHIITACIQDVCIKEVGQTPPQDTWDTMGYCQQAGGKHPTGMHSC